MKTDLLEIENLFAALADQTRLRLLNLMNDEEVCVLSLTEALQEPQPKISRHLAFLRRAGLVTTTREGKWIYYKRLIHEDRDIQEMFDAMFNYFVNNDIMRRDRERFLQIENKFEQTLPELNCKPMNFNTEEVGFAAGGPPSRQRQNELADFLL